MFVSSWFTMKLHRDIRIHFHFRFQQIKSAATFRWWLIQPNLVHKTRSHQKWFRQRYICWISTLKCMHSIIKNNLISTLDWIWSLNDCHLSWQIFCWLVNLVKFVNTTKRHTQEIKRCVGWEFRLFNSLNIIRFWRKTIHNKTVTH